MTDITELIRVQEASYRRAGPSVRSTWPPEQTMSATELAGFLDEHTYCVLATTTPRDRAQARAVGFSVFAGSFWIATVAGGRLRNLLREPWASLVVMDGENEAHRAVAADGPVVLHDALPAAWLDEWTQRHGSPSTWAAAWIELRPERLFSYLARR